MKLSLSVVGDVNDENNFSHQFLLTNTQVSSLHKASENGSPASTKLSKTQLHKIGQSEGFLSGGLIGPLLKTGWAIIGNVLKPLAKCILRPLELMVVVQATDAASQKKCWIGYNNISIFK